MQVAILVVLFGVASASTPSTPVSRVVQLIGQVAKQAEEEGKKEEDLYETYVCWAKSIIDSKTASNAAAESRITELKQYISDIEAGRIEFTSERQDLEKELAQLNSDIEEATAMREKEEADFDEAKDEMDKTIAALTDALKVLKEATAKHQQGVLFTQNERSAVAGQSDAASTASLSYAMTLGDRFLSKGDALFLRRLLSGEVPKADWKKLNRKATFKMSYKARSGKIQDVLASMLSTFEANLEEAVSKEAEAKSNYEKLMASKKEQKKDAEKALLNMDKENGARGMNKEEAQAEVDSLTKQVENDTKYIAQVKKSLAEKKEEWKDRQALRAAEVAAMNKAISILHSDDARDMMKKSFSSQGYLFLQTTSNSRGSKAASILRKAARDHQARLFGLAARASTPSHFKEVVAAIDKMVDVLKEEEAKDLEIKEECESNRARDSRKAVVLSRDIDEMTDLIATLEGEIADHKEQVARNKQDIQENKDELKEATRVREAETAEFKVSKKDDEAVHELILQATGVLKNFYSDNGLMLIQKSARAPASKAGEAPPPPPATWEAPYGGKTEESTGIIAILEMVAEDVQKDIALAQAAEEKAQTAYDEAKKNIEANIANLEADIVEQNSAIADKEETIESTEGDKRRSKNELKELMATMKKAAPNCDYFAVNYVVRTKNRQTEMDGLQKGKAILEGGKFDAVDENREIKPGDAFVQLRR
jgi:peptidoglycan hydrolase CwlO-like protein